MSATKKNAAEAISAETNGLRFEYCAARAVAAAARTAPNAAKTPKCSGHLYGTKLRSSIVRKVAETSRQSGSWRTSGILRSESAKTTTPRQSSMASNGHRLAMEPSGL